MDAKNLKKIFSIATNKEFIAIFFEQNSTFESQWCAIRIAHVVPWQHHSSLNVLPLWINTEP